MSSRTSQGAGICTDYIITQQQIDQQKPNGAGACSLLFTYGATASVTATTTNIPEFDFDTLTW